MKELVLNGNQIKSKIYIEKGILKRAAELCLSDDKQALKEKNLKVCVITDENVAPLYLEKLNYSFKHLNIQVSNHVIKAGEEYKTLETVSKIYDKLCMDNFSRNDMIIALGGGVVGDIAGYVAATFLRGLKHLIQIPTTLLAQVDSSVGGKCGVDLPQGKNLVGLIRQPNKVLIDVEVLDTLQQNIFESGIAEIIKYGCIMDSSILDIVSLKDNSINIEEIVTKCIEIKIKVVEEDENEYGIRKILNFGHTIGHSIEKLGNFTQFSHGQAVAIGMAASLKIGEYTGITTKGCYKKLLNLLQLYHLPISIEYPLEKVYQAMMSDKKRNGNSISFIFIEDFGKVKIKDISLNELKQLMKVLSEE